MLGEDDFCFALVFNKIFGTLVNFEATPKFEQLENSIHEELILCSEESNYIQILDASQVKVYGYYQYFIANFMDVQIIVGASLASNKYKWQLDVCWDNPSTPRNHGIMIVESKSRERKIMSISIYTSKRTSQRRNYCLNQ